MKKFIITLIAAAIGIIATADGTKMWLYSHSGNHQSIDVADVDSISYTAPKSVGQAMAAGSKLWVHSHSGNHISIDIADLDSIGFTESGNAEPDDPTTVTDACGNKYKVVTIGSQVWMAENMRCSKYDTQSERAGATLSTSSSSTYAPYYINGRNATSSYSVNLTSEQRSKLGYLYNWAAAVGLATESAVKNQTSSFSGNRQGICPNGWHVPTVAEFYVGYNSGKKLKTTSGWYDNGNGTDEYHFAALPAGYFNGYTLYNVGTSANFWTATPYNNSNAHRRYVYYDDDNLYSDNYNKSSAQSVRCIKN